MVFRCLIDRAEVYDKGPLSYKCAWLVGVTCLCLGSERQWACILGAWHHRVFIQKLSSNPPPLLFSPMPLSHFHAPFQGKGREKANKQDLFPEFIFSKGTRRGGGGAMGGGRGGSAASNWKLLPLPGEICVHYLQSQTNRSRVQVYVCVCATARKPPCLSSSITVPDQNSPPSPSLPLLFPYVCLCVYLCFCVYRCVYVSHVPVLRFPTWVPGLDPEKHLGKPLADMELYLKQVTDWWILCLPIFPRHCSTSTYKHMNTISQTGCLMLMYKVI